MKYLTYSYTAFMALTLSACATDKTMFYKDGQSVHVLSCSGPTFTGCLEKASNICQSAGYDILDRASVRQSGLISSSEHKELIVACRKIPAVTINPNPVAPVNVEAGAATKADPSPNPNTSSK